MKLQFASMIAHRSDYGGSSMLFGRREYSNARISIERNENGTFRLVCAKVFIKNLDPFGEREIDLSADISEREDNVKLSMSRHANVFGSRCKAPFAPFPELEQLAPRVS